MLVATVVLALFVAAHALRAEPHAATGARVELNLQVNPNYPGTQGVQTLTDGETGAETFGSGQHLGFEGPDVEATLHLPAPVRVHTLAVDLLQQTSPAIFMPVSVDFALSANGTNFRTVATVAPETPEDAPGTVLERVSTTGLDEQALAVRVRMTGRGQVPAWHRSPGSLCWIFVSEILVNPGEEPESPFEALPVYSFGDPRRPLAMIENALRTAESDSDRNRICASLVEVLGSAEATVDAKTFCCTQLALFGGAEHVAPLVTLLSEPRLTAAACQALVAIAGTEAEQGLIQALRTAATPDTQGQLLQALGELHTVAAIPLVRELVDAADPALAALAVRTLVRIAPTDNATLGALPTPLPDEAAHALLEIANESLDHGDQDAAVRVLRAVSEHTDEPQLAAAAYGGLLVAGVTEAAPRVVAALGDERTRVRTTAAGLLREALNRNGAGIVAARFHDLPVEGRVACLEAVAANGSAADLPLLERAVRDPEPQVAAAALRALGAVGGEAQTMTLVRAAVEYTDERRAAAAEALARLQGAGVADTLVTQIPVELREWAAQILVRRGAVDQAPALFAWASTEDTALRKAVWDAMSVLGNPELVPGILRHLSEAQSDTRMIERAVLQIADRHERGPVIQGVTETFARTPNAEAHSRLLSLLGRLPSPESLACLREGLAAPEPEVRVSSVRALDAWPDTAPLPSLLDLAGSDPDQRCRLLALRTAVGLLELHGSSLPADQLTPALARCLELASLTLAAAAHLGRVELLPLASGALGIEAVRDEAAATVLAIAERAWTTAPEKVRPALEGLADAGSEATVVEQAHELLAELPPPGFRSVFNTWDLGGWQGCVGTPVTREGMLMDDLRRAREQADAAAARSWTVENRTLISDGTGVGLGTVTPFRDFELRLDWRLQPGGHAGIALRGTPVVQIHADDSAPPNPVGAEHRPLQVAGPPDDWNTLELRLVGDRLTAVGNGETVAERVVLENPWRSGTRFERVGPTELLGEGNPVAFRRIAVRELERGLPAELEAPVDAGEWESLFDGHSLQGWQIVNAGPEAWSAADGVLTAETGGGGWLALDREYGDYVLEFEFNLPPGGNSGVFLRPPLEGNPAFTGIEVQLLDDAAEIYRNLRPGQYCASVYGLAAATPSQARPAGEWQHLRVLCAGRTVMVWHNHELVAEADLDEHLDMAETVPGVLRETGFPGLQNEHGPIRFRNLRIKTLAPGGAR
jgi:HEAT repeat protein